jgi:hypothetical protein
MYYYRITKYNPIFRDGMRYTIENEWTAVSDIGNPEYNSPTASEYLFMEDKYWNTLKYLLDLCNIKCMKIQKLEKRHDTPHIFTEHKFFSPSSLNKAIKNDRPIGMINIELVTRLCLREEMWCQLKGKQKTFIHFGYDYYVFFGTSVDHTIESTKIPDGIYIENFKSPYVK